MGERMMAKSALRLVTTRDELRVVISAQSWHAVDEPDLFPEGAMLRRTFGVTWANGLFREPLFGILQSMPAPAFLQNCERAWEALLRDKDLLSFSYQYQFEREMGVRHNGGMGGGFHVRGLVGSIRATPKGYCTLRLRKSVPDSAGNHPMLEVIDLRKSRGIQTDDAGWLKVHRRSLVLDWFQEMPRILEFCRNAGGERIEVRFPEQ